MSTLQTDYLTAIREARQEDACRIAQQIQAEGGALPSAPILRILVIDHAGSGYSILTTLDNVTWLNAWRRRTMNAYERDQHLERMIWQSPAAEVRAVCDFYGRIPADWLLPGARVI